MLLGISDCLCPALPPRHTGRLGPESPPPSRHPAGLAVLVFLLPRDGRHALTNSLNLVTGKAPPSGAGSLCGLTGKPCMCLTPGSGNSRKRGPSKVTTDQVAACSYEGQVSSYWGGESEGCTGREPWRVGGLWVCRARGPGLQAGEQTWEGTSELGPGLTAWITFC